MAPHTRYNTSAVVFSLPGRYCTCYVYMPSSARHAWILAFLIFPRQLLSNMDANDRWSVIILNGLPYRKWPHFPTASIIEAQLLFLPLDNCIQFLTVFEASMQVRSGWEWQLWQNPMHHIKQWKVLAHLYSLDKPWLILTAVVQRQSMLHAIKKRQRC